MNPQLLLLCLFATAQIPAEIPAQGSGPVKANSSKASPSKASPSKPSPPLSPATLCLLAAQDLQTAGARPALTLHWVERGLQAGLSASDVFRSETLLPLRLDPKSRAHLRRLCTAQPASGQLSLVPPQQKGTRLSFVARLCDAQGRPVKDAVLRFYHADPRGCYSPEVKRPGAGERNPYYFGILRPDREGRVRIETLLPGGYGGAPPHLHIGVHRRGKPTRGGAVYFEGSWRMDPEVRSDVADGVAWLGKAKLVDTGYRVEMDLRLR